MYNVTKGEAKSYVFPSVNWLTYSNCFKSAIFGDSDNLWEVLWYPNSGVGGGETASLYLSCVVSWQALGRIQADV